MLDSIFLSSQKESIKQFQNKIFSIKKDSESKDQLFEKFLEEFFKYIPLDYINHNNHLNFWQFAKEAYELALHKSPGEKKLQVEYCSKNNRLSICSINSDKPFIVDSIKCVLKKLNLDVNFIFHPVINVTRDTEGKLTDIFAQKCQASISESILYVEIYTYIDDEKVQLLKQTLQKVLLDVEDTYLAWPNIHLEIDSILKLDILPHAAEFLKWLKNDNFTFLGFINLDLQNNKIVKEIGNTTALRAAKNYTNNFIANAKSQKILIGNLDKVSTVHKSKLIDYMLMVREQNMYIILGLYRSNIQYQSSKHIPILSDKLQSLLSNSGFASNGYNYKKIKIIFEALPKEMLLQLSDSSLQSIVLQILSSMMSKNLKVFVFADMLNNFAHVLIFMAKDYLSSETNQAIKDYLVNKLHSSLTSDDFNEICADSCYLYNILEYKNIKELDTKAIEQELCKIVTSWHNELKINLNNQFGPVEGGKLFADFRDVFPKDYQHKFNTTEALGDIEFIEKAILNKTPIFKIKKEEQGYELKIFNAENKLGLSQVLPILENLGIKAIEEQNFALKKLQVWIHKFSLELNTKNQVDLENLQDMLAKILLSLAPSDTLCQLVTSSNLTSRQLDILRALTCYLQQTGFQYSKDYVSKVLITHHPVALKLIKLFQARFDTKTHSTQEQVSLIDEINKYLEGVKNNSEDKALKYMLGLVLAIVRTNAYQLIDNDYKPYISFKFASAKVPGLALPLPFAEIYVYCQDFEGVHLRGGSVSRGGLRWSDRPEDYRTEALGLMKAQNTKNSVIVPGGSKGAFFIRNLTQYQDGELSNYIVACYKNFLRGLLDLTDNIVDANTSSPLNTVIYDEPDPYLVVAADKGTATFSDYANEVSKEYNFWLGDAFASGGSSGYDHKKIAITASGAWVSTLDHLKSLNTKLEDATFLGIGDMSGDVFGNGMLLSQKIKLVAAFDHRHIFIDPCPKDAILNFNERKRLFELPRSKWSDYNLELISQGGGVFERSAKSISLSRQVQEMLGLRKSFLSPDELIKALLTSKVDVIWNGGIGTYVKASNESHQEVGDKANDALRACGKDLKAKVVVEGGNLGFSQKGRIEFALLGGKINTDFIDNSAGVDCSDHEVNLKICLSANLASGKMTLEQRNDLLREMTQEVTRLVLLDNFAQSQAITIQETSELFNPQLTSRLIEILEQDNLLNREVEALPSKEEISRRIVNNLPFTRPEIAVLLSYSKMFVYNHIINSNIFQDAYFQDKILPTYFPKILQQRFPDEIKAHQLSKEIIATIVANKIINQLSGDIVITLMQDLDSNIQQTIKAYFIITEVFQTDSIWSQIENFSQDQKIKIQAFSAIIKLIRRATAWILKNYQTSNLDIEEVALEYKQYSVKLIDNIEDFLSPRLLHNLDVIKNQYTGWGVGANLAEKISKMEYAVSVLDILYVSNDLGCNKHKLAKLYFKIGNKLKLDALRIKCDEIINSASYFSKLSAQTIKADFYNKQRLLSYGVAQITGSNLANFVAWYKNHKTTINSMVKYIDSLILLEKVDINILILANYKIQHLMEKIK
jgi:glutamate dehydrogenase